MPVFILPALQVDQDRLAVTGPILDHLRKSLRVQPGEELWFGNPTRRRYRIRVTSISAQRLTGDILEERTGPPPIHPALLVGQALLKGERMDWMIQKSTELGIGKIIPLISQRVISRPRPERLITQRERWQRIAHEAAQQAERWDVPEVTLPRHVVDWMTEAAAGRTCLRVILSERSDDAGLSTLAIPAGAAEDIALAIGPEGGWAPEELAAAEVAGFQPVSLGPRILRAETAAMAAVVILQSRLGAMG